MSGIFSFVSKDDNLTVIDLALDEFLKKQRRRTSGLALIKICCCIPPGSSF